MSHMRLPPRPGEWIQRDQSISFEYEGTRYTGYAGDSISSALMANGVRVLGRSFKYHRARGVLSLANQDINAMLTDGKQTHIRADVTALQAGMALTAVNTAGGVLWDRKRLLNAIAGFLPVGFYYKTFHKPAALFPWWEKLIRRSAGLGEINPDLQYQPRAKITAHYDVLVVGAGLAGMVSALQLAQHGLRVCLVDEQAHPGGSLGYDHAGMQANAHLLADLQHAMRQQPNLTLYTQSYAAACYADKLLPLVTPHGLIKVRAKAVLVASGAMEQPPVFRNNDLPGVMLGSAAQRLIHCYAVKPFQVGVVFTANDTGYRVALDLLEAGCTLAAVIDMRPRPEQHALIERLEKAGIALYFQHVVYEVVPDAHQHGVRAVRIAACDQKGATQHEFQADAANCLTLACDGVAMSAGWAPNAALLYQAGCKMRYDDALQQFVPQSLPAGVFASGKVCGVYGLQAAWQHARQTASQVLAYLNVPEKPTQLPAFDGDAPEVSGSASPSHPYPMVAHPKGKNFVDFDEDLQLHDFFDAAQEGFDNIELMKRFTTVGMGPSQGKHSNMNAIRILSRIRGLPIEKVGTTTARPMLHPVALQDLAGRLHKLHRKSVLHDWHLQAGAVMTEVGVWQRPAYYASAGMLAAEAVASEVLAVRQQVGMMDNCSLGKIWLQGADAVAFLERAATTTFADQLLQSLRHTLFLDETGTVLDDALVCRVEAQAFYLTVSTSQMAVLYRELQRYAQIWGMQVLLVNLTGAQTILNIAGPNAAAVLCAATGCVIAQLPQPNRACTLSAEAVPLLGLALHIQQVSFLALQAYEIHLPAAVAPALWHALMHAGATYGIRPFGTDAQRLLRLEMGHYLLGYDSDGLTTPYDLGAEIDLTRGHFVGARSLEIIALKPLQKQLVAFVLESSTEQEIPKDCNLVIEHGNIIGRVTSVAMSPSLHRVIGFAYVPPSHTTNGTQFQIRCDSGLMMTACVVDRHFLSLPALA